MPKMMCDTGEKLSFTNVHQEDTILNHEMKLLETYNLTTLIFIQTIWKV